MSRIKSLVSIFCLIGLTALALGAWAPPAQAKPLKMNMTTETPSQIVIPDKLQTRIGTLKFFDGMPTPATVQKAYDFLDFSRAVNVFLEELGAASMAAMRAGLRQAGVEGSNQVAIFRGLMDSKSLWLTANTETVYASTFLELNKDGPTVIECPPNVLGILDDMWMRYICDLGNAGPDKGRGGKYLILPPGYKGKVPEGYHVFRSRTYGAWLVVRGFLVDGQTGPTVANLEKGLKIYPLSRAQDPPATIFKDLTGKYHNTVHANDFHFFEEINTLVQEEPLGAISPEVRGRLALLGVAKGKPFHPDAKARALLNEAALVGAAIARSLVFASRDPKVYLYPGDKTWFNPFVIGNHEFKQDGWVHHDAMTLFMYGATGITPAMAIAMPGVGSQYAAAATDATGHYLDGSKSYKLTLPPKAPVKDFWSIVLYDPQTRSMLQTDQRLPSLNSQRKGLRTNPDGSVTMYFGPRAPRGKEANWVQTVPGKGFFLILRLYGPLKPWFDKTWRPGKIEPVG